MNNNYKWFGRLSARILQAVMFHIKILLVQKSNNDIDDIVVRIFVVYYYYGLALSMTGVNNKYQFARPASAQHAADVLGTTVEELSRAILSPSGAGGGGASQGSLSPTYRSVT